MQKIPDSCHGINSACSNAEVEEWSHEVIPDRGIYVFFFFFVKCLKEQPHNFGVLINYVTFANSQTPFSSASKLNVNHCRTSSACHFYFNRIVHLWNVNPNIDTSLPFCSINRYMYSFLWKHFLENFDQNNPCTFNFVCACASCH